MADVALAAEPQSRSLPTLPTGVRQHDNDALCVATLVDRSVITAQPYHADVETHGELTIGRTVVDTHNRSGREPTAAVAMDYDRRRFLEILFDALGRRRRPSG